MFRASLIVFYSIEDTPALISSHALRGLGMEFLYSGRGAASTLHFCLSALTSLFGSIVLLVKTVHRIKLAVVSLFSIFGWLWA